MTPGGTPLTPAAVAAPLSTFFLYGRRVRRPSAPEQVETWFVFPALSGRGSGTPDPYRDGGSRSRGGGWCACHHLKPVPPGRGDARSARYDTPPPRRCRSTSSPPRCGRGGQACRADPRRETRVRGWCPPLPVLEGRGMPRPAAPQVREYPTVRFPALAGRTGHARVTPTRGRRSSATHRTRVGATGASPVGHPSPPGSLATLIHVFPVGATHASPGRAAGAGIDRACQTTRCDTPHHRLASLGTPSPALCGRGGRGVRGLARVTHVCPLQGQRQSAGYQWAMGKPLSHTRHTLSGQRVRQPHRRPGRVPISGPAGSGTHPPRDTIGCTQEAPLRDTHQCSAPGDRASGARQRSEPSRTDPRHQEATARAARQFALSGSVRASSGSAAG